MVAFGAVHFARQVGHLAGERFAYSMRDNMGVASTEQQTAAMKQAAHNRFVPAMRKKPALVKGVPSDRVAAVAVYTCTAFDHYYEVSYYQDKVRRHIRKAFIHGRRNTNPGRGRCGHHARRSDLMPREGVPHRAVRESWSRYAQIVGGLPHHVGDRTRKRKE